MIRAVVLSLKEMPYVEAARGLGASHLRMMARHILPQCIAPYLILATTHLGVAIIIEASLGFLGVGIPPPTPTWGNMLADSLNAGLVPPWWLVLFPGLAITLTVLAFNLLGDGIRDILDPRLRGAVAARQSGALRLPSAIRYAALAVCPAESGPRHRAGDKRRSARASPRATPAPRPGSAPSRRGSAGGSGSRGAA